MIENYLGNKTVWKILRLLSQAPGKATYVKEIRKYTGAGNFAIANALKYLVKYKIVEVSKYGNRKLYRINMLNPIAKKILEIFDIEKEKLRDLQPSIVTKLAKIVDRITETTSPIQIILFGSYAKGSTTRYSDIDLCVILPNKDKKAKQRLLRLNIKNVQLHCFYQSEFEKLKKAKDTLVEQILTEGINLL